MNYAIVVPVVIALATGLGIVAAKFPLLYKKWVNGLFALTIIIGLAALGWLHGRADLYASIVKITTVSQMPTLQQIYQPDSSAALCFVAILVVELYLAALSLLAEHVVEIGHKPARENHNDD